MLAPSSSLSSLVLAFLVLSTTAATAADLTYLPKSDPRAGKAVVVTADGKPFLSMNDLNQGNSIAYYTTALQMYQRQRMWLRAFIGERLLEGEAIRRSISVEHLLKTEAPPEPVSEAIVAQFLSERGRPGASLSADERRFLEEERRVVARNRYIEKLWKERNVQITLPTPEYPQVLVSEGNVSPVLGIADGPANLIEFCAFTSPACRDTWKTLRELVSKHGWRLRIVHRDFPVPSAPASLSAAIAARCAHRQSKFWPYHDLLYEHQDKLDEASLKAYARQLGLDAIRFDDCFDKKDTAQEIEWDVWEGRRVQLPGLPGLFLNTIYIPAGLPAAKLIGLIEAQISGK